MTQSAFEAEDIFGPLIFPRAAAITPVFREMGIPMPSPRAIMPECLSEIVAGILGACVGYFGKQLLKRYDSLTGPRNSRDASALPRRNPARRTRSPIGKKKNPPASGH